MNERKKVVLLFSNYGPYHIARLAAASQSLQDKGYDIYGVELSRKQEEYPWKTDLSAHKISVESLVMEESLETTPLIKLIKSLNQKLCDIDPDVVAISGYFRPTMLFAFFWCFYHQKKTILFSESTAIDARRKWWKEAIKRFLLKHYNAALVGGAPQRRYLVSLGIPEEAISLGYNVVGNEIFHPDNAKNEERPIKNKYFLAINRFVKKKNILLLIGAYAEYKKRLGENAWDLVLCGDGVLREIIEQEISRLKITRNVHLTGFLQQEEILPYLWSAECFIHSSTHEQWGLVVNEAMSARLPVIVSNRCGCCEDLVIEGVNGFRFNPFEQDELTDLMEKMSSTSINKERMGNSGLAHIQNFSPQRFATGFRQAVEYALR